LLLTPAYSWADTTVSTERYKLVVETMVSGLEHPWSVAFLPGGDMLVTERPGRLRVVRGGRRLDPRPVAGLPKIEEWGQGGALDVALHPNFVNNHWVYLSYAGIRDGNAGTEVLRGRFDGTRLTDVEVLFRAEPKRDGKPHFGSRLLFAPDGTLFITLGDRGNRDAAQDLGNHLGSIVRLLPDGSVPPGNPMLGRAGARPEIYSYGHRNVQGIALRPGNYQVWAHEHGPQGGDEVNLIEAGVNYGWPVITYGVNYVTGTKIGIGTHKEGMAQPKWYWVPSIAPSGMTFYDGDKFPNWRGNLFVGALKSQLLVRLELQGDHVVREERMLQDKIGRIRDVRQGPDGYLYLLTDESRGQLARIRPAD